MQIDIRRMDKSDLPHITDEYNSDLTPDDLSLYCRMYDSYVLMAASSIVSYITLCGNPLGSKINGLPLHIVSLGTHPLFRLQGLTSMFLKEILSTYRYDFTIAQLEVRKNNVAAFKFYKKNGFYMCDILGDYYTNPSEDALIMRFGLQTRRQL